MDLNKELEKRFSKIEGFFSQTMLLEFLNTPAEELEQYQFGLGTMIRLKLLRSDSILYKAFIVHGYTDRDEMVMKIIKEFHQYLWRKI